MTRPDCPSPMVSAVIPTYNYGQYVCEAVESALNQTYRNMEVIVVDDGSTDDTRERLAPYMDSIRYIYQENQGLSAARNTGIRAASGEWIALLDSDDTWTPRKTEAQLRAAEQNGWDAVAAMHGGYREAVRTLSFEDTFFVSPAFGSSGLVRADCFERTGLFDEELRSVEDRDMMLRLGRRYRIGVVYGDYVRLRTHDGQMSKNALRMKRNFQAVLRKAFADNPELPWHFKLRTLSYLHLDAALEYRKGRRWSALAELAKSVALWPLPLGRVCRKSLLRARLAACLLAGVGGSSNAEKAKEGSP